MMLKLPASTASDVGSKALDKPKEIEKATEMTDELPHELSNELVALQAAHELIHKQRCERISRSEDLKKLVTEKYGPALRKVGIESVTFDISDVPTLMSRGRHAIHALLLTSILALCLTVTMPWYLSVLASVPFLLKIKQMWNQYSAKEVGKRNLHLDLSASNYGHKIDYYYRKYGYEGAWTAPWCAGRTFTNYEAFEALAKHYTVEQVEARLQQKVKAKLRNLTKAFTAQQLEDLEFTTDLKLAEQDNRKQRNKKQLALPPTTKKE